MQNPPFKLVVWDFDGVLNANIIEGRFVWVDRIEADLGVDKAAFQDFVFKSGRIRDVVAGRLDLRDVVAEWLAGQGYDIEADAFLAYWFEHDALPDAEVISWMQATPMRCVIGTNNEARRAAYIEDVMGFGGMVERVFASGRMKVAKPDADFFKAIEAWSGISGRDVLLVDDHQPNISAAQALGWAGFHFSSETRADLPAALGLPC